MHSNAGMIWMTQAAVKDRRLEKARARENPKIKRKNRSYCNQQGTDHDFYNYQAYIYRKLWPAPAHYAHLTV